MSEPHSPPGLDEIFTQRRWVGARVQRLEDPPLLTGRAAFVADLLVDRAVDAAFVRSPHAHALITGVDTSAAEGMPGVHAVLTGSDLQAAPITDKLPFEDAVKTPRYPLARDRVRFAGEAVVMVIADDRYLAEDAADAVMVDYDPLPSVVETQAALDGEGSDLFDDALGNVYFRREHRTDGLDEAFAAAAYVHRRSVHTNRYLAAPMEGRGIVAEPDPATGELVVRMSTQAPHVARTSFARALGLSETQVRVAAPAVGGAFGMKNPLYPEDLAVAEAAIALGRPVRWIEDRTEHLTAAAQGKEQLIDVELAFDDEARLIAARGRFVGDSGAYSFSQVGGLIECMIAATAFPGPYDLQEYGYEVVGLLTNKSPVAAYRGVGFTAAQTSREIALDEAARAMGIDPIELRRRNLIPAEAYPYTSASGMIYDSGSNHECLDVALDLVDADSFREEQRAARQDGRFLGLGISPFVEMTSYGPKGGMQAGVPMRSHDNATALLEPDGTIRIAVGTFAHGQGHGTTFAQLAADVLSVTPEQVRILEGDTASVPFGMGTFGSRSAVFGGGAVTRASVELREQLFEVASLSLEVDPSDLELTDGHVQVVGEPATAMSLEQLAATAYFDVKVRDQLARPRLEATAFYDAPTTFPNGCFAVVAEVEPATGEVRLLRAGAVDDCGRVINPTIVEGQLRGGFAQGVGGALLESLRFSDDGQPLSTTYLDYLLPRATEIPRLAIGHVETPSPWSVGGVKGMAEGGAIGAPAAVINAVLDALAPLGVRLDRLPLTPGTVWEMVATASQREGQEVEA